MSPRHRAPSDRRTAVMFVLIGAAAGIVLAVCLNLPLAAHSVLEALRGALGD